MKKYEVVIIGAGTSGLTARREVSKKTDNYVLIDDGPLGTTCARVGCMPSKVFIQAANDYFRKHKLQEQGILNGEALTVDTKQVLKHVRSLRDRFVRGVKSSMPEWEDKLIRGRAEFIDANTVKVNGEKIYGEKIIISVGSRPVVPRPWLEYKENLITTDDFFELDELPKSMAVIGLGVIGIELGQALSRLDVDVVGATVGKSIGGLSDPKLQEYVAEKFQKEFPIHFNGAEIIGKTNSGLLQVKADDKIYEVEKALIAVGRRNNLDKLKIENLKLELNKIGVPEVDSSTMSLKALPHIYLPGDGNATKAILHEAADEGVMAGFNAVRKEQQCFKRRLWLGVTFSDPNIATVGKRYSDLVNSKEDFVTGAVSFEGQGRSIVKLKEQGILHVYANKETGKILGAELQAPDGEHLAHLLAWAMSMGLSVFEALKFPFYHPVIEEGLRTALRDAASKVATESKYELARCSDAPIR